MMIMTIFNDQFCFAQKLPKNAKMWKCKILDTFSMTFWLRTKFLGPAKIQNWTSGSVLEIPNSWLLVVEGAAELCRLILLISDHPIQQGYYKFWNQLFSGTPCRRRMFEIKLREQEIPPRPIPHVENHNFPYYLASQKLHGKLISCGKTIRELPGFLRRLLLK